MATGGKIRSVSGSSEWRDHRRAPRLPLQLDGRLAFDEQEQRRSAALHGDGRLRDQTFAADADQRPGVSFGESCRIGRQQGDRGRNAERRRKSLCDLSRNVRRGEGRPSRVSSLVSAVATELCRRHSRRYANRAAWLQLCFLHSSASEIIQTWRTPKRLRKRLITR